MAKRKIVYYDFDLDLNPADRWIIIFNLFEPKFPKLRKHINKLFKQFESILPVIKEVFNLINTDQIMFYDEIKYIAHRMNLAIYEVILLQLIYETSAACTTAIFEVGESAYFLRTMDWPMSFLKNITIGLNIKRNNKSIAKVIGWVGCVGFFTVQTDTYTAAINYRRTEEASVVSIISNAYKTLNMNWPISYLVRYAIEKQLDRSVAIKLFETAKLISPTYITICAYATDNKICIKESVIITRNWDTLVSTRSDNLIQTNCDCDKDEPDILWSLERRELFNILIDELNELETCSKKIIMKTILVAPILNQDMIYVYFSSGNKSIAFI